MNKLNIEAGRYANIFPRVTLDEYVDMTKKFVIDIFNDDKTFQSTYWLMCKKDALMYTVKNMPNDEGAKDAIAQFIKAEAKKHKAVGYIFATEAWSITAKKGEDFPDIAPSKSPDRKEILMLVVESIDHINSYTWEITRDEHNKPSLSKSEKHKSDKKDNDYKSKFGNVITDYDE